MQNQLVENKASQAQVPTGIWLMGIAVFHDIFGLFVGAEHLLDIVQHGGFATVTDDQPWRMAIFWFMMFGVLLFGIGGLWHWVERQGLVVPRAASVGLGLTSLIGIFLMPLSGFWLVLLVAAAQLLRQR